MSQKKWSVSMLSVILGILIIAGALAIAAEYGTQEDPLVSQGYITNVLVPDIYAKVDQTIKAKTDEYSAALSEQVNKFSAEIDLKIKNFAEEAGRLTADDSFVDLVATKVAAKLQGQPQGSQTFTVLKVPGGKTLALDIGAEVVLRIGTATCVASAAPGLIDLSSGDDLTNGKELVKNHLYVATVEGRGIKASAEATVLVRGSYTIK